jgi:His-Xaa-Ser system protein HxsD
VESQGYRVAPSRIVTDLRTASGPDRVELDLDDGSFPRDAVYAAAFTFIDRCYVHLEHPSEGRTGIVLRPRAHDGFLDGASIADELANEVRAQAWRVRLAEQGRELTAQITAGAFGGGGAPLAADEPAPFDDPLGIALQWEREKAPATAGGGEEGS